MDEVEFSHPFQVDKLGPNPKRVHIEATEEQLNLLKDRFELLEMKFLKGEVMLQRLNGKKIQAEFTAKCELVQECVVTGKPVKDRIELDFMRIYDASFGKNEEKEVEIDIEATEELDPIIDGVIDLGSAIGEELALDINPFPRADDAAFEEFGIGPEITEEEVQANNPFAVLAGLKNKSD